MHNVLALQEMVEEGQEVLYGEGENLVSLTSFAGCDCSTCSNTGCTTFEEYLAI